jgi:hypothetical protein
MEGIQHHELFYTRSIIPWLHKQREIDYRVYEWDVWEDGWNLRLRFQWVPNADWGGWKAIYDQEIITQKQKEKNESLGYCIGIF